MRSKIGAVALSLSMLLLSSPGQSKQMGIISGQVNHDRINSLTSQITWNRSLGQAEQQAASQGKMIFWVHMLGTIDGAT
ncbi:MAG TPA: hypothetical protein V6C72_14025 [Chroococcales cyanobacterium]